MKNEFEVKENLIQAITAADTEGKLTFWGKGGVLNSIVTAFSQEIAEVYHDIFTAKRKLSYLTATGTALDDLAAQDGLTRKTASAAGTTCIVTGTAGTVIPQGSRVKSSTGTTYESIAAVTIGADNVELGGKSRSLGLGTKLPVVAQETGTVGNTPRGSITEIVDTVTGWDAVTNLLPVTNGEDIESDEHFRYRVVHRVGKLTQSTEDFYIALAQEADNNVLRAYITRGGAGRSVQIAVYNRAGVGFSPAALSAIQSYVGERTPDLLLISVVNGTFVDISPIIDVNLASGYSLADAYVDVADALSNEIAWKTWAFGGTVRTERLIAAVNSVDAIQNIKVSTFSPREDITVPAGQLPRLAGLQLNTPSDSQQATFTQAY